jgi:hypothetical protein
MSESIVFTSGSTYAPAATTNGTADNAKTDAAPLKAFETALLNVKASASASQSIDAAQSSSGPSVAAAATTKTASRSPARAGAGDSSAGTAAGAGSGRAAAEAAGGPQPTARSGVTALAGSIKANSDLDAAAKSRQSKVDGGKSETSNAAGLIEQPASPRSLDSSRAGSASSSGPATGAASGARSGQNSQDAAIIEALAPTSALSSALSTGTTAEVKAALETTLQGFADGTVPEAIKAALSKSGTVAALQSAAEIGGLLDNITTIAQDLIANGPLSDADFAKAFDQLFWVSNWFDLFTPPSTAGYDPVVSIYNSVNSALAVPMDIFYTRAVMVPLVDVERVVSPGLVNRRAVRANTEAVPGSENVDRSVAQA